MSESVELPPHRKVHVDLGPRAYDVVIGKGAMQFLGKELEKLGLLGPSLSIITDDNVYDHKVLHSLFEKVSEAYRTNFQFLFGEIDEGKFQVVPAGESSKSLAFADALVRSLAKAKVTRNGAVIGVGGGVIGDLTGFVAATYLRGIAFVQVPTTLLAMVDSSVGGKTGVNLPEGKNLVGAFHQPKLVIADLDTLATLPAKEFAAGMAEVIKYGAIRDARLFERVARGVKPGDADLDEIVEKCVAIKARIVERDEFETKGERALLNFGHTIGHAIEKVTEYKKYLHGEAISLGMRAAAWLSVWHAGLPESDARRIEAALIGNYLPVKIAADVDRAAILAALGNDKKVAADGRNRWVLLKSLGEAVSGIELPEKIVARAVDLIFEK